MSREQGVIHRDIKPANLMVDATGQLWVTDFGLASTRGGPGLTMTGDLMGTVRYMSPEQTRPDRFPVDHRTDIYSLGLTLHELLTLETAFPGSDVHRVIEDIREKEPLPLGRTNPAVPPELETILLKAIAKDRDERYPTARELALDLQRFLEDRPIRARRPSALARARKWVRRNRVRAALAAALLVVVTTAVVLGFRAASAEARRVAIEYDALCARADEASLRPYAFDRSGVELLTQAITLDPDRPEAYVERALGPGRSPEQKLADLDAAASRGASPRLVHLARAFVWRGIGEEAKAARQEELARPYTSGDPRVLLFEARLATGRGDHGLAHALFTETIDRAPLGSRTRYRALNGRSELRERTGDLPGAMADLYAVRARGHSRQFLILHEVRIASMWRRLGRSGHAESLVEKMLGGREADPVMTWLDLCEACRRCGEWGWLDRISERGLVSHPESVLLLVYRSQAPPWIRADRRPTRSTRALSRPSAASRRLSPPRSERSPWIRTPTRRTRSGEGSCWSSGVRRRLSRRAGGRSRRIRSAPARTCSSRAPGWRSSGRRRRWPPATRRSGSPRSTRRASAARRTCSTSWSGTRRRSPSWIAPRLSLRSFRASTPFEAPS
jgi:hypothetical protein